MSNLNRTRFPTIVLISIIFLISSGCISNKAIQKAMDESAHLLPPVPVQRPMDDVLADFGAMLRAYVTAAIGERSIPIEIDFIGNESGIDKEMPTDMGQYARNVIEKIGDPFQTFRSWPAIVTIPRASGANLPAVPNDHPKPPQPIYRLVGSLLHASERLEKGGKANTGGQFGNGHGQSDIQLSREKRRTITSLTVALTLEDPSGVAVRGATAVYRIDIEKSELSHSFSVYVGGSGIGIDGKLTTTQDSGDALSDAMAITIMHLLGNALMVPYYRCSAMFVPDAVLDGRVRNALNRLTRSELEQTIKRYLFLKGFDMDMNGPSGPDMTGADRAIAAVEMQHQSLDFSDRTALVEFSMRLWKNIDYSQAAQTVADRMAQSALQQREQVQQATLEQTKKAAPAPINPGTLDPRQQLQPTASEHAEHAVPARPQSTVSPLDFGWGPGARLLTIDVSLINDAEARKTIIAAVQTCSGCDEVRAHPNQPLLGVLISSSASELQRALRSTSLPLDYQWTDARHQNLILIPK